MLGCGHLPNRGESTIVLLQYLGSRLGQIQESFMLRSPEVTLG